ncbi:hypothetical protein QR680_007308 [Steinernema hermaphroditum]|uniref:Uncharacterized protein n=1 Tax=Steinernema hermaphroditum TaxID=289476 RepID=A0AA39ICS3_9BILA|nr:hypothetical protein QR680_007308 [Steinernema hermaphroditum]
MVAGAQSATDTTVIQCQSFSSSASPLAHLPAEAPPPRKSNATRRSSCHLPPADDDDAAKLRATPPAESPRFQPAHSQLKLLLRAAAPFEARELLMFGILYGSAIYLNSTRSCDPSDRDSAFRFA